MTLGQLEVRSGARPRRPTAGRRLQLAALVAAVLVAVICGLHARVAPAAGEPLALRWARTCADHPLRTGWALWLFSAALLWPRSGAHRPDDSSTTTGSGRDPPASGPRR